MEPHQTTDHIIISYFIISYFHMLKWKIHFSIFLFMERGKKKTKQQILNSSLIVINTSMKTCQLRDREESSYDCDWQAGVGWLVETNGPGRARQVRPRCAGPCCPALARPPGVHLLIGRGSWLERERERFFLLNKGLKQLLRINTYPYSMCFADGKLYTAIQKWGLQ